MIGRKGPEQRWALTMAAIFVLGGMVAVHPSPLFPTPPAVATKAHGPLGPFTNATSLANLANSTTYLDRYAWAMPLSFWANTSAIFSQQVKDPHGQALAGYYSSLQRKAEEHLIHVLNPNAHFQTFFSDTQIAAGLGVVTLVGVACFVVGPETAGLGCVAIALALLVAFVILVLMAQSNSLSIAQTAATNLANQMVRSANFYGMNTVAIDEYDFLQDYNATNVLWEYAADAAALLQLGNSTFNGALDVIQGNVSRMFSVWLNIPETEIAVQYSFLTTSFNYAEGSANQLGAYCSLEDTATPQNSLSGSTVAYPAPTSGACAPAAPASYTFASGQVTPYQQYQMPTSPALAPAIWLDPSAASSNHTGLNLGDPTNMVSNITFAPIDGRAPVTFTFAATHQVNNFTEPLQAGGYYVYSYSDPHNSLKLYAPISFPLNAVANQSLQGQSYTLGIVPNAATTELVAGQFYKLAGTACVGTSGVCWNQYGSGSPVKNATLQNEAGYLYRLLIIAETNAQAYWFFLRSLGYTSPSQLPLNCIIPTPTQLLPPTISTNQLSTLNYSQVYSIYIGELLGLARTFNATATPNSFNFCGKHVTDTTTGYATTWGIYAWGWIYNPNATHTSNGTGSQTFGDHTTWNLSGIIYLTPLLSSWLNVTLNQTWLLPESSVTLGYYQPITNGSARGATQPIVNRLAPVQCLAPTAKTGCNISFEQPIGYMVGNSTLAGGSQYPTHDDAAATTKISVYLTICFVAKTGTPLSAPTYATHPNSCAFYRQTIGNATGNGCSNVITQNPNPNCGGGGGILIAAQGACGLLLVTQFATSVSAALGGFGGTLLSCFVAWIVVIVLVAIVAGIIYVAVRAVLRDD